MDNIALEASWKKHLLPEFAKKYMLDLKKFLIDQQRSKKVIYPKNKNIFHAFALTPLDQVKVVIVGQDPYHGENQAHGLCFSVLPTVALPPSLVNIYKELYHDLGIIPSKNGCLTKWATQGVLLLNSVLTVEAGKPGSHQNQGWEMFTDQVIHLLNKGSNRIIFILWGGYAYKKCQYIDINKHLILKAAHPSPLSAHRGFFGCRHFSKANEFLIRLGKSCIDWRVD
jgi:uracil-DNA glycosylase